MNQKTKRLRIVALLLAVMMLLPMMPAVELHVHAEAGTETPKANVGDSGAGTTETGTTETGTTETGTTETGTTETGTTETGTTDSTAYGQDTGICTTCGGTYINGICSHAGCTAPYQEPNRDDSGTVFLIENAGNLFWFAAKVNGGEKGINAKLTADINLENRAWTAIGTESNPYAGTFDGGNFTISNFSLIVAGNSQGLFGAVSGGTVKNFTLKGKVDITATIDISDVSNIKSFSNVGGVVGYATSKAVIENVTAYVNITDSHTPFTYTDANGGVQSIRVSGIGGIVGYMDGSTVSNCLYDGTITSVCGASIAGIVGNASNSSTVDHCTNKGNVSAENNSAHIGGIAGDAQTGTTISYCLNYGNVTSAGGDCIGGVVAYANQNVKIDHCGNTGIVTCTADGDGFIGGILGYINNRNFKGIFDCFNYGAIVTEEGKTAHAGAILGYNRNSGSVYSNNYYLDSSFTKAVSDNAISDVYSMTADQFTSGEVTYKLNGSKNAGAWKQTLGKGGDSYPNFTGKDVSYGYLTCKDTQMSYANSTVSDSIVAHAYGDDGVCTACGAYQPCEQNTDGYYEIGNLGQLLWFAEKVNSGETTINGKLTKNIDATSVSNIGIGKDADHAFAGIFDGNYKTLKIALVSKEQYVAPFPYINGATIKNLTVSGTIKTTHKFAAGIVGRVQSGNAKFENCLSLVAIDSNDYTGGDGTHGGLIGVAAGTTTINNCGFAGSIIGTTTTSCGGIVGWTDSNVITNISNSFVAATFTLQDNNGNTFGRNPTYVKLTNCYYLNALSDASTATQMSAESFASGEVAYKLNGNTNAGAWKQTLGSDSCPNFTGKDVYYGYADCTATTQSYINEPYTTEGHHYDDNGFCKRCDDYQAPTLVDGYYEIDNAGKLYWFAAWVNKGNFGTNAKLTANITVNPGKFDADGKYTPAGSETVRAWTPIVIPTKGEPAYTGTFDGNNKYISGLYVNGNNYGIGLFYFVGKDGTVKNVAVKDFYFKGTDSIGGVAGHNSGTIMNCTSSGTVIGTYYVGGVVGGNGSNGTVTNCASTCTVSGTDFYVGGVVGENGGSVTNCMSTGTVGGTATDVGGVVGHNAGNGTVTNCYYLNTGASVGIGDGEGEATAKTQDQFISGEVTYLLNGKRSAEDVVWKQTLDGKSYPGFTGKIVYYGYLSCEEGTLIGYTNNENASPTIPDHDYDNGICTVCGKYEPCTGEGTAANPYLIANAGNLYWFAARTGAAGGEGVCAVLTADITVNPGAFAADGTYTAVSGEPLRQWTPIGTDGRAYTGTFDGKNHTISGLYYNGSDSFVGLFGYIEGGATIQNIGVTNSYFKTSNSWPSLGGIVGNAQVANAKTITISNCSSAAHLVATGNTVYVGGVVGGVVSNYAASVTIQNCANTGELSATSTATGGTSYCGGVVGGVFSNYAALVTIQNCMSTGNLSATTADGASCCGGVAGSVSANEASVTVQNCFSTGNLSAASDTNDSHCGGVAGYAYAYADENGQGKINISDCYYTANDSCGDTDTSGDGADVTLDKCATKNADAFASGEVAWLLNGGKSDGVWKQTLGTDDYPGFTGGTVYSGYEQCNETRLYLNDSDKASKLLTAPHDYDANGFCTKTEGECHYQPAVLNNNNTPDDTTDDYYEIANAGQLYWFANFVNSSGSNIRVNAKLTANITVNPGTFANDGTYTPGKDEAAGTTPRTWTPIVGSNGYYGTFDGDSHTITGLYYNSSEAQNVGLFAYVSSGATVKNVGVVNCYFKVSGSGNANVGGVAGFNGGTITGCYSTGTVSSANSTAGGVVGENRGTIMDCYNTSAVIGSVAGGVAGENSNIITNCYNTGKVTGSYWYVGGVVGHNGADYITNCYYLTGCAKDNSGTAQYGIGNGYQGNPTNEDVAGVTTAMTAAEFKSGKVTWLLNGKTSEGTTEDPLVWKQTLDGTNLPGFTGETVYGGYIKCDEKGKFSNKAADVTGAQQEPSAHRFGTKGFCTVCDAYQPCEEGEGTDNVPYLIKNAGNLYWFAAQVNGGKTSIHGRLTADITVNKNVLKSDGTLNGNGSSFRAWTPIGNEGYKFTGTFSGVVYDEYGNPTSGRYTISGLYFNDTDTDYVGLFGYIGGGGTVEEVIIRDSYFKGAHYVGGVAGRSNGLILHCSNSATVIGTSCVGGIAGYVYAADITSCTNSGAVTATTDGPSSSAFAGGIVGYAEASSHDAINIDHCYNTGKVTATANGTSSTAFAGGLMGYAFVYSDGTLTIRNCYNTGKVTAETSIDSSASSSEAYAGGLAGYAWASSDSTLTFEKCYSTGDATAKTGGGSSSTSYAYFGGLVGYAEGYSKGNDTYSLTLQNCYFLGTSDDDAFGRWQETELTKVCAKTEAQFKSGEVTWLLNDSSNSYLWRQTLGEDKSPNFEGDNVTRYIDCQGTERFINGDLLEDGDHYYDADGFCIATDSEGTVCGAYQPCDQVVGIDDVYRIKNVGNLYWFAERVNKDGMIDLNGLLVADIVVNKNVLKADGTLNTGTFRAWTPIGNSSSKYQGSFDGGGYTISGLYCNISAENDIYAGLFGCVNGAKIQNVTVADAYFNISTAGNSSDVYVGGIVGYAGDYGDTEIINCTSSGTFKATADGVNFSACAGGIVGYVYSESSGTTNISGCTSTGTVTATATANTNSANSAYAGGIVGYVKAAGNTEISSCTNSCTVTATVGGDDSSARAGGIVGCVQISNVSLSIRDCMNSGMVTAKSSYLAYAGGLVGYAHANGATLNINRCYNTGHAEATADGEFLSAYAGGLMGYAYANSKGTLHIKYSYNTGNATATANGNYSFAYAGGLAGYAQATSDSTLTIESCYNIGHATATANGNLPAFHVGGLVGYADNLSLQRCYFLGTSEDDAFGSTIDIQSLNVAVKTEAQFKSGEVTWLLNGEYDRGAEGEPLVWYQTIGTRNYPGFAGSTVSKSGDVYYNDAAVAGYTLYLDGMIGVNFYTLLSDRFLESEDAMIAFLLPNGTESTMTLKDALVNARKVVMGGQTYYVFTWYVAAHEMTSDIGLACYMDGERVTITSTTVKDYAMYIINHSDDYKKDDVTFAKALLNYGAASQTYFRVKLDALANAELADADRGTTILAATVLEKYAVTNNNATGALGTFTGASLYLDAATSLRAYFEPADDVDITAITFTVTVGGVVKDTITLESDAVPTENGYVLSFDGLMAYELGENVTFTATYGEQSVSFTCSAMTYAYNVISRDDTVGGQSLYTEELKTLMSALYHYMNASKAYGGTTNA